MDFLLSIADIKQTSKEISSCVKLEVDVKEKH